MGLSTTIKTPLYQTPLKSHINPYQTPLNHHYIISLSIPVRPNSKFSSPGRVGTATWTQQPLGDPKKNWDLKVEHGLQIGTVHGRIWDNDTTIYIYTQLDM